VAVGPLPVPDDAAPDDAAPDDAVAPLALTLAGVVVEDLLAADATPLAGVVVVGDLLAADATPLAGVVVAGALAVDALAVPARDMWVAAPPAVDAFGPAGPVAALVPVLGIDAPATAAAGSVPLPFAIPIAPPGPLDTPLDAPPFDAPPFEPPPPFEAAPPFEPAPPDAPPPDAPPPDAPPPDAPPADALAPTASIAAASGIAIGRLGSHAASTSLGTPDTTVAPPSSSSLTPGSEGPPTPLCAACFAAPAACWATGIWTVMGLRRGGGAPGTGRASPHVAPRFGLSGVAVVASGIAI
jgi:hypothetical protein